MRERSAKGAGMNYSLRRLAGGSAGIGAMAIMVMMALSPIASAMTPGVTFKNATPYTSMSFNLQGCATGKVTKPTFSTLTGFGKMNMKGSAHTCLAAKGGQSVNSFADFSSSVGLIQSVKLSAAKTNVAITWNVSGLATGAAAGVATHCPTYNYSFSYFAGTTWVFYNSSSSYCAAEAFWEIYSDPYVYDATQGTYNYGTFSYMYNQTGNYHDMYSYTYNYSNSSYTNVTYSGSFNGSFGATSTNHVSWGPTANIAGTFNAGDHLIIYATLYAFAEAYVEYESHAHAAISMDFAPTVGHADLTGIVIT